MKWISWLKRSRNWERRMHAEFQFHFENQVTDYIREGLTREEAEACARRDFGAVEWAKDECRDQRGFEPLRQLWRDLRFALRSLRKTPGYTTAAMVTLALGIGATTAIFSAWDGVVLRPLPYHEPDRLVLVLLYNRSLKYATDLSYPDFLDWQRDARSFEQIAAFMPTGYDLVSPGSPEHVNGYGVSSSFFRTLGVSLAVGSSFSPDADRLGGMPAAIISHRIWRERFGETLLPSANPLP